jgi:transposase
MVDTDGPAFKLQAHSADMQDRDGAGPLLRASRPSWPFVALGYAAPRVADASPIRIEVVRKADNHVGFAVIARRWVVERFFAWINRNRRLAKDVHDLTPDVPVIFALYILSYIITISA